MKERPILFSAPMVRAILDGSKTQTRRVVKGMALDWLVNVGFTNDFVCDGGNDLCPYGKVGDQLWVRETWAEVGTCDPGLIIYRADYPFCVPKEYQNIPKQDEIKWKPSIHIKRAHSRIWLEITNIRVERLNDISEADSITEGIERIGGNYSVSPWRNYRIGQKGEMSLDCSAPSRSYMTLWESINGAGSWAQNPWVWVIEFKKI
jgi:hypothetical protein